MNYNLKSEGVFKDHTDGSLKSVFRAKNNGIIEMTLIHNKTYDVVCVPTHHFCCLGCKMCHLTNNKLNKKMLAISANDFIEALTRTVCKQNNNERRTNKQSLLISFMGVGEPLLNLKLILEVFKNETKIKNTLQYKEVSYALATTIPTKELFINLLNMVNENNIPLKVHFSLHTPFDEKRFNLIPSTKVNIKTAISLLLQYKNTISKNNQIMKTYLNFHHNNIPIEIHYTLIKNNNDGEEELNKIYQIINKTNIPIKFLKFNPTGDMEISNNQELWLNKLNQIPNSIIKTYTPPGKEIGSSCGEFTKHYYHEEIETKEQYEEFLNWQQKHIINE